ncbi:OmpA family protein [Defluviimonas sp. WL0002]|uniref:OmpA family protein n=1 Tax=Albidovulum marisflavi TaxID=2984159 RepID=A0ABT2Z7S1_9RHOB|nr:OmpA family protein [Defluviimonas sp. WL0002]MCV2867193.1 OmpA family protein [Defluviimonas sp. WL0002]
MKLSPKTIGAGVFAAAAALSILAAVWAAFAIEHRAARAVRTALDDGGYDWAEVSVDGLQVTLSGMAPSEALRFRALSAAGTVVDGRSIVDRMDVVDPSALGLPEFTLEILRNGDGISLIGLVPSEAAHGAIVERLSDMAGDGQVTDMLETSEHPEPEGWQAAVDFGLRAMESLSRSKISVTADNVSVMAISTSAVEKARIEAELRRAKPAALQLSLDISAPRPVIAPFTLRFVADEAGARFDACSANSERARDRIIAAATRAGINDKVTCTIGLGVPSPDWAQAVAMGIDATAKLGKAVITFSDADVSLVADAAVAQELFDRVVGELESNLPEVFSLHAVLAEGDAASSQSEGVQEFSAILSEDGGVELRGRVTDQLAREAVESYARSRFGAAEVYAATRLDPGLPKGWSIRVLAALEALGHLQSGQVRVRADRVFISGTTDQPDARDDVARILSDKLGEAQKFQIDISYVPVVVPEVTLPSPEECVAAINSALSEQKIDFEPGSARIAASANDTLDTIADHLRDCADAQIEVAGHTDSQGSDEMNMNLSRSRAQSVVQALMARRVLTGNLSAVGYGETIPIATNDTEEGREQNRRIEFRLLTVAEDGTVVPMAIVPGPDTPRPRKRPERAGNAAPKTSE